MSATPSGLVTDVLFLWAPLALVLFCVGTASIKQAATGALSMRTGLAAVGVGTTFHHPGVRDAIIAATGAPLMSTAYHGVFVIAGICVLDVLAAGLERSPRRRRAQVVVGLAVLALLPLPWLLDPPGAGSTSALYGPDFFNDGWQTAAHAGLLVAFLAWAEVSLLRHCLGKGLPIARTAVGTSLLLIAATAVLALVCLATAALTSALWSLGLGHLIPPSLYNVMTAGSMGLATLFVTAGAAWEPVANAQRRRHIAQERQERLDVLLPHWRAMSEVLTDHSPFTDALRQAPRSAEQFRLQEVRLVGEIQEAHWRLYGLVEEAELDRAIQDAESHGLVGPDAMAYADHQCLQLGLQRWRSGRRQVRGRRTPPTAPSSPQALVNHLRRADLLQRRLEATPAGQR